MKNFWDKLPKPFFCLAPMADVTDVAFRRMFAKYGKPDVMYNEFVSAEGLVFGTRKSILPDLRYTEKERPIVAQVFTAKPDIMEKAAKKIADLKFDGLDINMGCPDKAVEKQGAGSSLMKNLDLAQGLIRAAQKGAPKLPISVKTRIGYYKNQLDEWLPALLETNLAAVAIHCRTRKEMSKVSANWDAITQAVKIRDKMKSKTLIIGNGDITDLNDARQKASQTNCDGIMIGRGVFGNPWFFSDKKPTVDDKLNALVEHAKLYEKLIKHKSFALMKKHFKAYVSGWDGAKQLRMKLMQAEDSSEVEKIINEFRIQNSELRN